MGWADAPVVNDTSAIPAGIPKAVLNIRGQAPKPSWQDAPVVSSGQPATVGDRAAELRAATGQTQAPSLSGSIGATLNGVTEGIPVAGPMIEKAIPFIIAQTVGRARGLDPADVQSGIEQEMQDTNEANPIAHTAGEVAGTLGSFVAGGEIPAVAKGLGMAGPIGTRIVNGVVSNAGIAGADALARGESPEDAAKAALIGGAAGGVVPAAGAAFKAAAAPVARAVQPAIGAVLDPAQEALRRFGTAVSRDAQSGQPILNPADEATARAANVPLVNADRGGETVRALARSTANQNPEARATIDKFASDRFAGQAPRAENFVRRLFGGSADDLGYQERLKQAADAANAPAYRKAYAAPNAQAMWNPDLEQLMQSDAVRRAVRQAESRGSNRAAVEGFPAVKNPFVFGSDGSVSLKPGVTPNLRFWDQVKRNLDGMITTAQRGAKPDNTLVGDLSALNNKLKSTLDAAVPEYKAARSGAAGFFGADDALQAGKNFANAPKSLPETRAAFSRMKPAEKQAFSIGYASELIDKIRTMGDRTNVINRMFGSPAQRQAVELILGPEKAKSLEAYVRVEDLADKLRGTLGGSTTIRQLTELGIGAGAGAYYGNQQGNWLEGAMTGALAARGIRYGLNKADGRVMQAVAKLLTSDDQAAVDKAVQQAQQSPALMQALTRLENFLAAPVRAGTFATGEASELAGQPASTTPAPAAHLAFGEFANMPKIFGGPVSAKWAAHVANGEKSANIEIGAPIAPFTPPVRTAPVPDRMTLGSHGKHTRVPNKNIPDA